MKKKIIIAVSVVLIIAIIGVGLYGADYMGYLNSGNSSEYALKNVGTLENSPLENKNIIFLGSSVTLGMQSKKTSFVEYLAKRNSFTFVKEAVSGTTLVDANDKSYVKRMLKLDKSIKADAFICQLSTNDAQKNMPLGVISDSTSLDSFDCTTVTGAMEYIICYAKMTWNCPVIFYTGTDFGNEQYEQMITRLYELQTKWGIGIIDLYNILDVTSIDEELYSRYMNDAIHPTRQGYLEWWTPAMETYLYKFLAE